MISKNIEKNKILTVAVAAYNIEKYAKQCFDSLIVDEILNRVQILVINDGSTDSTSSIAREYAKKYPDSFFLVDKENGGHGSVINTGIRLACGKYFKVLDGDDWFIKDDFVSFVRNLSEINSDLVYSGVQFYSMKSHEVSLHKPSEIEYDKEYKISECCNKVHFSIHTCTFKTALLKNASIKVTEKCFYEDNEYIIYSLPHVKTVVFFNCNPYIYRVDNAEQSISKESRQRRIKEHELILNNLLDFIEKNKTFIDENLYIYCIDHLAGLISEHYRIYLSFDKLTPAQCESFYRFIKRINGADAFMKKYFYKYKVIRYFCFTNERSVRMKTSILKLFIKC